MDINSHIDYWVNSSNEDFDVARQLLDSWKTRHGLFFLHLSVEKMLKACVCRQTSEPAPRTHNLVRLSDILEPPLSQERRWLLAELNPYNLEGRYPHNLTPLPDRKEVERLVQNAEVINQWLKEKL